MGSKKIVSIWKANTDWEPSTLRDVMSPEYSDDGDFLGTEFSKAFLLGFVDDDTVEADKNRANKFSN
ncbi:immunity 22 family protein [Pseudomonas fluorescens]|uniref:immunity 22 family protein n=1 Tax=Pseudomonas fluorescens TaxID=294 RepID=UPI000A52D485|nr:immunity 22 family protein [Pseudomonas fluorescens]